MVFIVITKTYFNSSRNTFLFVSVSKSLYLVLVSSRLLGVIFPLPPRFVAPMGGAVREFSSAALSLGRRFRFVPRYTLWRCVFIYVGPILFVPCIWPLVRQLLGMIWLNCSVNSRSPSFS